MRRGFPLMFPILQCLLWTSHFAVCLMHLWGQIFPAHFRRTALNECKDWNLRSPLHSADNVYWFTTELSRRERRKWTTAEPYHSVSCLYLCSQYPLGVIPTHSLTVVHTQWDSLGTVTFVLLFAFWHVYSTFVLIGKPSLSPQQQGGLFHILWVLSFAHI